MTATAVGDYENHGGLYRFHHVGILYKITNWAQKTDLIAEEENNWRKLRDLPCEELTPLAKQAVWALPKDKK